jgi:predicted nuclease with TOPRIM domain
VTVQVENELAHMRDENSRLKQIVIECEYQLEQSRRQFDEAETNAEQVGNFTISNESLPSLTARTALTATLPVTNLRIFPNLHIW